MNENMKINNDKNYLFSDDFFEKCARFALESGCCSTAMLQRRFGIGFNHALRIVEQLEKVGIISPAEDYKLRTILINSTQLEEILKNLNNK